MRNLHQPKSINYNVFNNISVELADGVELTNNVAGAEITVPPATKAWFPVRVNFSVNGILRLPPLSSVPYNYEYLFSRPPGSITAAANMVAISPTTPDTIDGRAGVNTQNTPVYLDVGDSNGTGIRIRAGKYCWHAVGGFLASESINVITTPATLLPWSGTLLLGFSGAASIVNLPLLSGTMGSTIPRGSVAYLNAGVPVTINRSGANTIRGSLNGVTYNGATSFSLAAGETAILICNGIQWLIH